MLHTVWRGANHLDGHGKIAATMTMRACNWTRAPRGSTSSISMWSQARSGDAGRSSSCPNATASRTAWSSTAMAVSGSRCGAAARCTATCRTAVSIRRCACRCRIRRSARSAATICRSCSSPAPDVRSPRRRGRRSRSPAAFCAAGLGSGGDQRLPSPDSYLRCLPTSLVISNMLTTDLPPKTAFSLSSALIMRLFF